MNFDRDIIKENNNTLYMPSIISKINYEFTAGKEPVPRK